MKYLQQRKPLGTVQKDGTVQITREFGDDIEKLASKTSTVEPADLTELRAEIATLKAGETSLQALIDGLNVRVRKLEGGYQS